MWRNLFFPVLIVFDSKALLVDCSPLSVCITSPFTVCMSSRKEDELEWQEERRRTKEIQLEEEALCQDNVEQSLKRTQRLLQVGM